LENGLVQNADLAKKDMVRTWERYSGILSMEELAKGREQVLDMVQQTRIRCG